jgi:hypothetical protein
LIPKAKRFYKSGGKKNKRQTSAPKIAHRERNSVGEDRDMDEEVMEKRNENRGQEN